ncbi:MAG TPA: YtcA family lipoprotein [Candidatus Binataceae bacterium]|nr:YtcA family lipoprotein [Candidatus Binataceae bacterium]
MTGTAGCDPVINIAGANFPAWLLCLLVGAVLAAIFRPLLVLARLDPYLGPAPIIYTSLAVMFALIVWIIFFNRT